MIKKFILATILSCSIISFAQAQTKAETKLYNTAKTKGDVKSINKFLNKFPNSVYSVEITKMKDSITFFNLDNNDVVAYMNFCNEHPTSYYLKAAEDKIAILNTSSISAAQAKEIANGFYGADATEKNIVKSFKNLNKENIIVIWYESGKTNYNVEILTQNGDNWEKSNSINENKYILDDNLSSLEFVGECKVVTIKGEQYVQFSYTNRTNAIDNRSKLPNNNAEYVLNLYSIKDNSIYSAMYSGVVNLDATTESFDNEKFIIYGKCNDTAGGGMYATEQMKYLLKELSKNDKLQPVDNQKFIVHETILWWYNNNPENVKKLKYGAIDKTNPIAIAFDESKYKEKAGDKIVNFFDIYNTTVIVSYDTVEKTYALIWCEPVATDKKGAQLSNLYHEKLGIVALIYYKGNKAIKKRINLNSRAIY